MSFIASLSPTRPPARSKLSAVAALLILGACAAPAPRAEASPLAAGDSQQHVGQHQIEVLVDGAPAPEYWHAGESYVLGRNGARYTLRVWNHGPVRVEAVVSVDGLDVIDGKPADYREKRGYVIAPGGHVDIDGWRLSGRQAAVFRFASVRDSYAARTSGARNVGVIGVALFPERAAPVVQTEYHYPFPVPCPWPQPPRRFYRLGEDAGRGESAKGSAAPAESSAPGAPPPAAQAPQADAEPSGGSGDRGRSSGPSAPARSGSNAAAAAEPAQRAPRRRPGLGTEFGESVESSVQPVTFVRANRTAPAALLALRYNDRAGLLAIGVDVDGVGPDMASDEALRRSADPFPATARVYASPPAGWRR